MGGWRGGKGRMRDGEIRHLHHIITSPFSQTDSVKQRSTRILKSGHFGEFYSAKTRFGRLNRHCVMHHIHMPARNPDFARFPEFLTIFATSDPGPNIAPHFTKTMPYFKHFPHDSATRPDTNPGPKTSFCTSWSSKPGYW